MERDHVTRKNLNGKKPVMLLIGMPDAHSSYWEMNIAQLPQGPQFTPLALFPQSIKSRVNGFFEDVFNPKKKAPYMGLHLIEQNLRDYADITLIDYPENDDEVIQFVKDNPDLDIIGISIGCENRVFSAKDLAGKIRTIRPDLHIIFGNYGAVAGKKLGILTEKEGFVLWDSEEERGGKKKQNIDFYSGEGVHDMRLWLKGNGIDAGNPHAPLVSESIPDPDIIPENAVARWITEKLGFLPLPSDMNKIGVSIGCTNNCSFCNTRFKFNRSKTFLYREADELFKEMEKTIDKNMDRDDYPPEASFFLMDENFMKDEKVKSGKGDVNFLDVAEELCKLIADSGKNIHWGTFSDVRSLLSYKRKRGSFIGLVRGGMQSLWIGLESREDVFGKRGNATTAEVEEMIKEIQALGISIIGSFIPGLSIHTEGPSKKKYDSLLKRDTYVQLNIWEDIEWWIAQNTGCRQVMMYSITGVVGTHEYMIRLSDFDFGHREIPGYNQSKISGKRLEEIDRRAREMFYRENGPVSITSVLTFWDGFMNLKDSAHPADIRTATYYYWMARRNLQPMSLATLLFNDTIFTRCSDKFLSRFARMFKELEIHTPPHSIHHEKYTKAFHHHDRKMWNISRFMGTMVRKRFIKKHLREPIRGGEGEKR